MSTETHPLLDSREAAAFLHVGVPTLRRWQMERKIPFIKLGRAVRYRRQDLVDFINDHHVPIEVD